MRISFYSNYLSPHQIPFCDTMYKFLGTNFCFVSCEEYSEERKKMGWDASIERPYEIKAYQSENMRSIALDIARNSDYMIWGSSKLEYVIERLSTGKPIIRYSERLFRKGFLYSLFHLDILKQIKFNYSIRSNNSYLLSASSFAPFDFAISGGRYKKRYKWGYFPQTRYYNLDSLFRKKSNSSFVTISWVARLIPLKHPEVVIIVAEELKKKGYNFIIKMIGTGELESEIKNQIARRDLDKYIVMKGTMTPDEVRLEMEASDLFLFTSDYNEGWGAVLNEAMNSGCVVFCSDAIGSASYLIKDSENGFLYQNGNTKELIEKIIHAIDEPTDRKIIATNAYNSITSIWSAEIAAIRFMEWCTGIEAGDIPSYTDGPMSEAQIMIPKGKWWII